MQPLISVDHELRQSAHRAEEAAQNAQPQATVSEDTPLLVRFPRRENEDRNPVTTVIVSLLLIMLITGVVIGVYLLVLQSNSENILPPINTPLQLVSRRQWDRGAVRPLATSSPGEASQVIVVQTDTEQCSSTVTCVKLLRDMQANVTSPNKMLPYNFLISSNGQAYESLGWHQPSTLFPEYSNALVVAFIGNFTEVPPSEIQVEVAKNVFSESVSQRHLSPSFTVIGRHTKNRPRHLFDCFKGIPQWNSELSDD